MKNGLIGRIIIAAILFLPVSGAFVYFTQTAQKFVHDEYVSTSFAEFAGMRATLEKEWVIVEQSAKTWSESPLVLPYSKLETISGALNAMSESSTLIRHVSVFDGNSKLVASTNSEFLLYGSQNKGLHPGAQNWPLSGAMQGKPLLKVGAGDYEAYYLLPLVDQGGRQRGVLALGLDLSRLEAIAKGLLNRQDRGVAIHIGERAIVSQSDTEIPLQSGTNLTRSNDGQTVFMTLAFSNGFLGQQAPVSLTVARNWQPILRLQNRVAYYLFGLSTFTALIFFLGVVFVGRKEKLEISRTMNSDFDVKIRNSGHGDDHLDLVADDRLEEDRTDHRNIDRLAS